MLELNLFLQDIQENNVNRLADNNFRIINNNENIIITEINFKIFFDDQKFQKISCNQLNSEINNNEEQMFELNSIDNNSQIQNDQYTKKIESEIKGKKDNDEPINIKERFFIKEDDSTVLFKLKLENNTFYYITLKKVVATKIMANSHDKIKITIKEDNESFSSIYKIEELTNRDKEMIISDENINIQYSYDFLDRKINNYSFVALEKSKMIIVII